MNDQRSMTAFEDGAIVFAGSAADVTNRARALLKGDFGRNIRIFDDETGSLVDVDLRAAAVSPPSPEAPRGRGRPKLGVVAREVTLLPRHWEWLARQPGGASVALRRLVDQAAKAQDGVSRARQEAAYRFMAAMAGDMLLYEEASRSLFAGDEAGFRRSIAGWPEDVARYASRLAFG